MSEGQAKRTEFRKIIDGKLYDTGKAEVIFKFRKKYTDPLPPLIYGENMVRNTWEDVCYLKTAKGALLFYCEERKDLQVVTEEQVRTTIRELDADAYIRIFREVEEG